MVFVWARDEEHPKPIWLVKALFSPNFGRTSPNFRQIEMDIVIQAPKTKTCSAPIYVGIPKKKFKWTMDSTYGPVWINIYVYIIFCAWNPRKGSKSETMTIFQKHIDVVKDNLTHIAAAEDDAENWYEAEDGDGKHNVCWNWREIYGYYLLRLHLNFLYIRLECVIQFHESLIYFGMCTLNSRMTPRQCL